MDTSLLESRLADGEAIIQSSDNSSIRIQYGNHPQLSVMAIFSGLIIVQTMYANASGTSPLTMVWFILTTKTQPTKVKLL